MIYPPEENNARITPQKMAIKLLIYDYRTYFGISRRLDQGIPKVLIAFGHRGSKIQDHILSD